jgi:hypothetical protein
MVSSAEVAGDYIEAAGLDEQAATHRGHSARRSQSGRSAMRRDYSNRSWA